MAWLDCVCADNIKLQPVPLCSEIKIHSYSVSASMIILLHLFSSLGLLVYRAYMINKENHLNIYLRKYLMAIKIPIQFSKDEFQKAQNDLPTVGPVQQPWVTNGLHLEGIDIANECIILVLEFRVVGPQHQGLQHYRLWQHCARLSIVLPWHLCDVIKLPSPSKCGLR